MTVIREADVIASVADALQYISYYHAPDFIRAMGRAYAMEQSPAARDAIAQILTNSRLCAEGHRPICQDTGIVVVFVKVGMGVRFEASRDLEAMINEGVRRAYLNPDNKLRASIVAGACRSSTRPPSRCLSPMLRSMRWSARSCCAASQSPPPRSPKSGVC